MIAPANPTDAEVPVASSTIFGTGGLLVIRVVPLRPSTVAVTVAEPAAIAVTVPEADTVTTAGAPLDHVTGCPLTTAPDPSSAIATSRSVSPTDNVAFGGVTVTVATGAGPAPPPPLLPHPLAAATATRMRSDLTKTHRLVFTIGYPIDLARLA